jgi:non-canonical purine NTP pyrophosphatase (RdgB/HAM1 family)
VAFIVEDTGFYLDCIPGLPGPLIKWFLKTIGREGIYEICKKFDNYKATGVTMIGYRGKQGEIKFFKGEVKGNVVLERGEDGFGWDPVFVPEGEERTFAEMSREEKNEISMRRKAFEELRGYLESEE